MQSSANLVINPSTVQIGLSLIGGPLVAVGNIVPFIGDLLSFGALSLRPARSIDVSAAPSVLGTSVALVCVPLTLATIALAWLYYRPMLALLLLGAAAAFALLFFRVSAAASCERQEQVRPQ